MTVQTFDEMLKEREERALMWNRSRLVDLYQKAQERIEKLEAELHDVYTVEQEIFDMRDSDTLTAEDVRELSEMYDNIARPKIHASNGQYLDGIEFAANSIKATKIAVGSITAAQLRT